MQLIEVNNGATAEDFICVNVELNRQYASYIRPLDSDVRAVFDRRKNKGDSFPVGGIGFFDASIARMLRICCLM